MTMTRTTTTNSTTITTTTTTTAALTTLSGKHCLTGKWWKMHFVRLDFLWVSEDTSGQQFLGVIQWVASPSLPCCFPVQQGFDMTLGYFLWVSHGFTRRARDLLGWVLLRHASNIKNGATSVTNHPHHLGLQSGRCFTILYLTDVDRVFTSKWCSGLLVFVGSAAGTEPFKYIHLVRNPEDQNTKQLTSTNQTWLSMEVFPLSLMIFPYFWWPEGQNLRMSQGSGSGAPSTIPSHHATIPSQSLTKRMGGAPVLEGTWGLDRTLLSKPNLNQKKAEHQHLGEEIFWRCWRICFDLWIYRTYI